MDEEKYLTYIDGLILLKNLANEINSKLESYIGNNARLGHQISTGIRIAVLDIYNNIANGNIKYYDGMRATTKNGYRIPDTESYRDAHEFLRQLLANMPVDKSTPVTNPPKPKRKYSNIYNEVGTLINEVYYNILDESKTSVDSNKLLSLGKFDGGAGRFKEFLNTFVDNINPNVDYGADTSAYLLDVSNLRDFYKEVSKKLEKGVDGTWEDIRNKGVVDSETLSYYANILNIKPYELKILEKAYLSTVERSVNKGKEGYSTTKSSRIRDNINVDVNQNNEEIIKKFLGDTKNNDLFNEASRPPSYLEVSDRSIPTSQLMSGILNNIINNNLDLPEYIYKDSINNSTIYILPSFIGSSSGIQYNSKNRTFTQVPIKNIPEGVRNAINTYYGNEKASYRRGGKFIPKFERGSVLSTTEQDPVWRTNYIGWSPKLLYGLVQAGSGKLLSLQSDYQRDLSGILQKYKTALLSENAFFQNVIRNPLAKLFFQDLSDAAYKTQVDLWNRAGGLTYAYNYNTHNPIGSYRTQGAQGYIQKAQENFDTNSPVLNAIIQNHFNITNNKDAEKLDDLMGGATYWRRYTMLANINPNSDLFKKWIDFYRSLGKTGYYIYHGHYIPTNDTSVEDYTPFDNTLKSNSTELPKQGNLTRNVSVESNLKLSLGVDVLSNIDYIANLRNRVAGPPLPPLNRAPYIDLMGNIVKFAHDYSIPEKTYKAGIANQYPYAKIPEHWRYNTMTDITATTAANQAGAVLNRQANRALGSDPTLQANKSLKAAFDNVKLLMLAILENRKRYETTSAKENDQAKENMKSAVKAANDWLESSNTFAQKRDALKVNRIEQEGASIDKFIEKLTSWGYDYATRENAANADLYTNWVETMSDNDSYIQRLKAYAASLDPDKDKEEIAQINQQILNIKKIYTNKFSLDYHLGMSNIYGIRPLKRYNTLMRD